jgi:hypothetical protein
MGEHKGSPRRTIKNHEVNMASGISEEVMNSSDMEQPETVATRSQQVKQTSTLNRKPLKDTPFFDELDIDYLDEHPNDNCTDKVTR